MTLEDEKALNQTRNSLKWKSVSVESGSSVQFSLVQICLV